MKCPHTYQSTWHETEVTSTPSAGQLYTPYKIRLIVKWNGDKNIALMSVVLVMLHAVSSCVDSKFCAVVTSSSTSELGSITDRDVASPTNNKCNSLKTFNKHNLHPNTETPTISLHRYKRTECMIKDQTSSLDSATKIGACDKYAVPSCRTWRYVVKGPP